MAKREHFRLDDESVWASRLRCSPRAMVKKRDIRRGCCPIEILEEPVFLRIPLLPAILKFVRNRRAAADGFRSQCIAELQDTLRKHKQVVAFVVFVVTTVCNLLVRRLGRFGF